MTGAKQGLRACPETQEPRLAALQTLDQLQSSDTGGLWRQRARMPATP